MSRWRGGVGEDYGEERATSDRDRSVAVKGPWSAVEDSVLRRLVERNGPRNWALIAEGLNGRTSKSCRLRWFNHLHPQVNKEPFTEEEDKKIVLGYAEHGSKWSVIVRDLPGRTDNSIKNHWHAALKKSYPQLLAECLKEQAKSQSLRSKSEPLPSPPKISQALENSPSRSSLASSTSPATTSSLPTSPVLKASNSTSSLLTSKVTNPSHSTSSSLPTSPVMKASPSTSPNMRSSFPTSPAMTSSLPPSPTMTSSMSSSSLVLPSLPPSPVLTPSKPSAGSSEKGAAAVEAAVASLMAALLKKNTPEAARPVQARALNMEKLGLNSLPLNGFSLNGSRSTAAVQPVQNGAMHRTAPQVSQGEVPRLRKQPPLARVESTNIRSTAADGVNRQQGVGSTVNLAASNKGGVSTSLSSKALLEYQIISFLKQLNKKKLGRMSTSYGEKSRPADGPFPAEKWNLIKEGQKERKQPLNTDLALLRQVAAHGGVNTDQKIPKRDRNAFESTPPKINAKKLCLCSHKQPTQNGYMPLLPPQSQCCAVQRPCMEPDICHGREMGTMKRSQSDELTSGIRQKSNPQVNREMKSATETSLPHPGISFFRQEDDVSSNSEVVHVDAELDQAFNETKEVQMMTDVCELNDVTENSVSLSSTEGSCDFIEGLASADDFQSFFDDCNMLSPDWPNDDEAMASELRSFESDWLRELSSDDLSGQVFNEVPDLEPALPLPESLFEAC